MTGTARRPAGLPRGRHPHHRLTEPSLHRARPGRHGDGNGLYLFVRSTGARSWIQRIVIGGRRRDLGLGSYRLVSLTEARRLAVENRRVARAGGDPTATPTRKRAPTVRAVVEAVLAARRANWRTAETEKKWRRLFDTLVLPRIGDKPVSRVSLDDLRAILVPHWKGRGSIGHVLRQHLDYVLRWAVAHGHRPDNPADQLRVLLPRVRATIEHHPSLPHKKVAAALKTVQATSVDDAVKLLLVFLVLCASRPGEAAGARWSEIDVAERVWTLPAARMKAQRPHRVPLSLQTLDVIERARALNRTGAWVFTVLNRRGAARTVARDAIARLLRSLGLRDGQGRRIVAHGFRTTFRVWAMEQTQASVEVCEAALAHAPVNQTVAAYARSDLLEARRALMQQWADYVLPRPTAGVECGDDGRPHRRP